MLEEDADYTGVVGYNYRNINISGGKDDRGALLKEDNKVIIDNSAAAKAAASVEHPKRLYALGKEAGNTDHSVSLGWVKNLEIVIKSFKEVESVER